MAVKPTANTTGRTYGRDLTRRMTDARITVTELADRTGLTRETIRRLRNGDVQRPSTKTRRLIDDALNQPAPKHSNGTAAETRAEEALTLAYENSLKLDALVEQVQAVVGMLVEMELRSRKTDQARAVAEAMFDLAP